MIDVVKIVRAFKPGDVVFIEVDERLTHDMATRISEHLKKALDGTGVRGVVLEKGMRVAAAEETIDTSHLETSSPAHQ